MVNRYDTTPEQGGHIGEELSAYIDGALGAAAHEAARLHLQGCSLCRADHDDLISTRTMLRSVPMAVPPRAFTLSEAMVTAAPKRTGFWDRLLAPRNAPRMALGSALSFALVLMLLVGNLGLLQGRGIMTPLSSPNTSFSTDAPPEEQAVAESRSMGAAPEETMHAQTKAADVPVVMAPAATIDVGDGSVSGGSASLDTATPETDVSVAQSPITGGALLPEETSIPENVLGYDTGAVSTATALASASGLNEREAAGKGSSSPSGAEDGGGSTLLMALLALFAVLAVGLGAGAFAARRRA